LYEFAGMLGSRGCYIKVPFDGACVGEHSRPEARVVPTPLRPHSVVMAASRLGSFLLALRDSVCTARGVLIRTRLVSCG